MRSAFFALMLVAADGARAAGPEYNDDPFGDADFKDVPLILEAAHPTRNRGEVSLLFASSVIEKYTRHSGGLLVLEYHFSDTLGLSLSGGYLHGALTNIVTDALGIIGNNVQQCMDDTDPAPPDYCSNINPNVPEYAQITGIDDAAVIWSPLYGKINVVSELDVNMQLYGLLGLGAHGTRDVLATTSASPAGRTDYKLSGGGFGEGGAFNNSKVHLTLGVGVKVFLLRWLALRGEARGLIFRDQFDLDENGTEDGYFAQYWFLNTGLTFTLF
ncbi:MAG: outer membrane beta-barrel domain-containing protein [Deltaproteobacteria bacterium]|nr:outer membrane beta-barrel domain-containing protein [Deltaproteobacteria bacterium]